MPIDNAAFQHRASGDWYPKSMLQAAEENRPQVNHDHDRLLKKWHQDMMHTGRGFLGIEVILAFSHPLKGRFGTVVGYHHTRNTPAKIKLGVHQHTDAKHGFDKWIKVTIKLEMSGQVVEASLDQVVERL